MEIIQAIALLCQINGNSDFSYVNQKQLQCQQYYIKCLSVDGLSTYRSLSKCIQERKL
jgi:hypothetical protein